MYLNSDVAIFSLNWYFNIRTRTEQLFEFQNEENITLIGVLQFLNIDKNELLD